MRCPGKKPLVTAAYIMYTTVTTESYWGNCTLVGFTLHRHPQPTSSAEESSKSGNRYHCFQASRDPAPQTHMRLYRSLLHCARRAQHRRARSQRSCRPRPAQVSGGRPLGLEDALIPSTKPCFASQVQQKLEELRALKVLAAFESAW